MIEFTVFAPVGIVFQSYEESIDLKSVIKFWMLRGKVNGWRIEVKE